MTDNFDVDQMLDQFKAIWENADPTVRYSNVKSFENVLDEQTEWENRYGAPWWQ